MKTKIALLFVVGLSVLAAGCSKAEDTPDPAKAAVTPGSTDAPPPATGPKEGGKGGGVQPPGI